jgi:hypothetical protein
MQNNLLNKRIENWNNYGQHTTSQKANGGGSGNLKHSAPHNKFATVDRNAARKPPLTKYVNGGAKKNITHLSHIAHLPNFSFL